MTLSIPSRVAVAVTNELNNGTFETSFTARRGSADWDLDFKDADDVQVDVVRRVRSTSKLHTRGSVLFEIPIFVAVRKRFDASDRDEATGRLKTTATDPLEYLLEQVYSLFADTRNTIPLDDETSVKWVPTESMFHWVNQPKLRQGLFEGYTELHFQLKKSSP